MSPQLISKLAGFGSLSEAVITRHAPSRKLKKKIIGAPGEMKSIHVELQF
jgi:hypothetical protein